MFDGWDGMGSENYDARDRLTMCSQVLKEMVKKPDVSLRTTLPSKHQNLCFF